MNVDPGNPRRRAVAVWTAITVATLSACTFYAAQIHSAIVLRDEMRETCDSHAPPEFAQYFWVPMVLSGIGIVAAVFALATSRRRSAKILGAAAVVVCGVVFMLSWYGFSIRNDELGPPCTNL